MQQLSDGAFEPARIALLRSALKAMALLRVTEERQHPAGQPVDVRFVTGIEQKDTV